MEKSSELDHIWVTRWLDDIGLPQYKDQFYESKVDGRMLQYLTVNDLLFLKVTSQLHHLSIKCAIHVLHVNKFNPNCLRRRPGDENKTSPSEVVQWSNHRVMEWLRSVDLAEYAPNLRGSGVHGGLIDQDGRGLADPEPATEPLDGSHDIANIYTILTKISGDMDGIAEIRKTTASVEAKLSALITRLDEVEKRVEFLEGAEKELKANPPATKLELDQLWDKVEDMENRSRRNNIRIVGIPEGKEGQDTVRFLDGLIPNLIDSSGRQLEIERAHRSPSQRPSSTDRPRPILARFLRSADRDFVLRAARIKGNLSWENNNIMIFPDFARSTQLKRDRFKECKKILHTKKILEPRFQSETLAMLLNIPPQKTLLRRHLTTNFNTLVGPQAQQEKREFANASRHAPLTTTAKVRPKKLGFTNFRQLRKLKMDESADYICPMDTGTPPALSGTPKRPYGSFRGISPILARDSDRLEQEESEEINSPLSLTDSMPYMHLYYKVL
ncbi:liprin-beta-2-like isoform X2 [Labeo rohita]|uniref:Liprin-beta-2-like isoform X2 n=1 Tax=Labeo rohita TaxID=84645 RepID=A0A498MKR3_LABRO|nr:liprin-beta-2-like isoform X2 [Labeo rohita]